MYDPPRPFFGGVFFSLLFVIGVVDSLNWDIFSYFFVLFSIYLGYGCAVVVRRRQVRIFMDWFFAGSNPPVRANHLDADSGDMWIKLWIP